MGRIDELLNEPNPGDTQWSAALRSWVNRLDAMEREFAPCLPPFQGRSFCLSIPGVKTPG